MNAASMIQATAPEDLLRKSLRGNAIFSTLCGLVFVFASGPIAGFLGELHPRFDQAGEHGLIQRVHLVGAVQTNVGDAIADVDGDSVGHGSYGYSTP